MLINSEVSEVNTCILRSQVIPRSKSELRNVIIKIAVRSQPKHIKP